MPSGGIEDALRDQIHPNGACCQEKKETRFTFSSQETCHLKLEMRWKPNSWWDPSSFVMITMSIGPLSNVFAASLWLS